MAKTLFITVLTLFVSTSFAEQFEDIKKPSSAAEWNEAAAQIGLGGLIKKAERDPNNVKNGQVSFTLKGNGFGATPSHPLAPSETKPGRIFYKGIPRDEIVLSDSETNRLLIRNLLIEVLKIANSKDEEKAKAVTIVASELLRANYGKNLAEIAPANQTFAGASGILGKGKGLHLGGGKDLGGGGNDGHAELPEAAPVERLLNYLEKPAEWNPATNCDGGKCTPIPGQVMHSALGGNLAIDDKLAGVLASKAPAAKAPQADPIKENATAEEWLLEKLKAAKKSGQKKFLIKFGDDTHCQPCQNLSRSLKKVDPTGLSFLSADLGKDPGARAAYLKYDTSGQMPVSLIYDLTNFAEDSSKIIEPNTLKMTDGKTRNNLLGEISIDNLKMLLGK